MSLRCIQIIQKLCQNSDPDLTGLGGELGGGAENFCIQQAPSDVNDAGPWTHSE